MKKNNLIFMMIVAWMVGLCFSCNDESSSVNKGDQSPYDPRKPLIVNNLGPLSGGLGTRVVVSGSNFGNDKKKVKLFFNKKEALILSLNNANIYAMVPKQPGESSVITVKIENGKDAEGNPVYVEKALEGQTFAYKVRATVTTVAGVYNESAVVDGPALEAKFARPVMVDADNAGNVMVADDDGGAIRLFSVPDNKVKTVLSGLHEPWQGAFNADYTEYYVVIRRTADRPLIAYKLSKVSNWVEAEPIYAQLGPDGKSLVGNYDYYGLTADDKYVYLLSNYGYRLLRVSQETGKMELIGKDLGMDSWAHMAFNPYDRKIYVTSEAWGKIFRFDPYKENLTAQDMEHVVGLGKGSPIEANGTSARLGEIEGIDADKEGNLYLADYSNHVIWKVDTDMNATVFAGPKGGGAGYKDGKPSEAQFNKPYDVGVDSDGLVYVADVYNRVIRCIAIQ